MHPPDTKLPAVFYDRCSGRLAGKLYKSGSISTPLYAISRSADGKSEAKLPKTPIKRQVEAKTTNEKEKEFPPKNVIELRRKKKDEKTKTTTCAISRKKVSMAHQVNKGKKSTKLWENQLEF